MGRAGAKKVDESLRTAAAHVYAAGGVAVHDDPALGAWRIDHWSDAAAQGEHAARTLLADLGAGEQPGSYQPRAPFTATVHGAMIAGAGLTDTRTDTRIDSSEPLVVIRQHGPVPVGVLGLDAAPAVFGPWLLAGGRCLARAATRPPARRQTRPRRQPRARILGSRV